MIWREETTLFWENKRKWAFVRAALFGAALLACPAQVWAVDVKSETADTDVYQTVDPDQVTHDEVQIDPDTGLSVEEEEEQGVVKTITLDSDTSYDPETGMFCEAFGDDEGETVTCTAANGMYVNGSVKVEVGSGLTAKVYRNGVELENPDITNLQTPGNYAFRLTDQNGEDAGTYGFRIINKYTNATEYQLPETFSLESVSMDGYSVWFSGNTVSFDEEGDYSIIYINDETEVEYVLTATIDHTPPTLELAAVSDKMTAHSAVDISDLESGATLTVFRDGDQVTKFGKQLTTPGKYQLTVQDEAGNITSYSFVLYMYFTFSSALLIALLILSQAALIGYIIYSRKKYRVR